MSEFTATDPLLTADLPGTGGVVKQRPEDFQVEEIPAYEPAGEGEHLFLWIEKRGLSAERLIDHLARSLRIPRKAVGTAGLKDRHAVTRQYVSVPADCESRLDDVDSDSVRVLSARRHGNKLRTGHLRGNRFSILIRDVDEAVADRARAIAGRLTELGVPNFFGSQRFGTDGETLRLGFDLLRGDKSPKDLPRSRRRFLLRLGLSSAQAWLFNRTLAERLRDGLLHRVLAGDVMQVVASGGPFVAEERHVEQARFDCREIVVTGPMFGPKMKRPTGEPARREERILADHELSGSEFAGFRRITAGTRRPYLIWPEDLSVGLDSHGLRLQFSLPSGSYATVVLQEFLEPAPSTFCQSSR